MQVAETGSGDLIQQAEEEENCIEAPRHSVASSSCFTYLEEFRNDSLNKDDKVINIFLNKRTDIDHYNENLEGLQKYFSDGLPALGRFLLERFHLPGTSWQDLTSMVTAAVGADVNYRTNGFTLAAVLLDLEERRRDTKTRSSGSKSTKTKQRRKAK